MSLSPGHATHVSPSVKVPSGHELTHVLLPSFTAEWFEMLEALVEVTETAQLQRKAPNPKAGDVAGISGAAPTLWDKETVAVRLLLEEGKLNVCLRLLYRHRRQVTQPNFPQLLTWTTNIWMSLCGTTLTTPSTAWHLRQCVQM